MSHQIHLSNRGIPLIYTGKPTKKPVMTVENYRKWYDLYLVNSNRSVQTFWDLPNAKIIWEETEIKFIEETGQSAIYDHCFHPEFVVALANRINAYLCNQSKEILIGRWETEYKGNYNTEE